MRACADEGTHYADLTGEVLFVRWSLDEVAARARQRRGDRARLRFRLHPVRPRRARHGRAGPRRRRRHARRDDPAGEVAARRLSPAAPSTPAASRRSSPATTRWPGAPSTTPTASAPGAPRSPPAPGDTGGGLLGRLRRHVPIDRDPETGRWTGPFLMASFNTRIVRLSNTLTDWSYGREFRYREVTDFGSSPVSPIMAGGMAVGLGATVAGLAYRPTRALLDRVLPKPGEGPERRGPIRGSLSAGDPVDDHHRRPLRHEGGRRLRPGLRRHGGDVGRGGARLALDGDRLPDRAGVLTPPPPWATCSSTGCGRTVSCSRWRRPPHPERAGIRGPVRWPGATERDCQRSA